MIAEPEAKDQIRGSSTRPDPMLDFVVFVVSGAVGIPLLALEMRNMPDATLFRGCLRDSIP